MSHYQWKSVLVLIADGVPDQQGLSCRREQVFVDGAVPGSAAARAIPVSLGFSRVRLGDATLRWTGLVDLVADIQLDAGDLNVERLLRADLKKVWPCLAYTQRQRGMTRQLSVETLALCTDQNSDLRIRALGAR